MSIDNEIFGDFIKTQNHYNSELQRKFDVRFSSLSNVDQRNELIEYSLVLGEVPSMAIDYLFRNNKRELIEEVKVALKNYKEKETELESDRIKFNVNSLSKEGRIDYIVGYWNKFKEDWLKRLSLDTFFVKNPNLSKEIIDYLAK